MLFRQYQLGCLSLYSYLIGDQTTGRAVVVDPQRDISQYLEDASAHGLKIERVIETHFHADFLSGHLELADAAGAVISYGEPAEADFPIETLADGQRLSLGEVVLEVRATPGHTPESVSIVVYEREGDEPWGVLTGDTLFVGDVGRPDLMASAGRTPDELARMLYRSLRDKLLTLPDATRIYPAHGAGSACGKHMSSATESTIGEQRAVNYALQPMTEDEFVDAVLQGQSVAPLYFAFAANANRHAHELLDDHEPPALLELSRVLGLLDSGTVVIDSRAPEVFASGHIRGSVNVGLDGRFAEYAGDVVRPDQPVVLVTDRGREGEAKVRLARIGFDQVRGALVDVEASLAASPDAAGSASRLAAVDVQALLDSSSSSLSSGAAADVQLVDVRNPGEQADGVIPGARLMPLATLLDRVGELNPAEPVVVYCAGGYRSSAAASLLRSRGFVDVSDVLGGFEGWKAAALPVVAPPA